MRKMFLLGLLLVTFSNVAVGVYAATCSKGGARFCGGTCGKTANGDCVCEGTCTSAEMDWVAGDPKPGPIAELEIYDY
jgi:hypothetical protein